MYPIYFKSIYFKKIWGGNRLNKIRSDVPKGKIGESWDISYHNNAMSIVDNGVFKGKTFKEIISKYRYEILGVKSPEYFPLLLKIIDTSENLSIQVHPDDKFAMKEENELGKTEAWYILDAREDSYIILGTNNCSKEDFIKAIREKYIEKYLNKFKVKKGDFCYIPSGMIHAISGGITLVEIQQNSDVTYRIYDYNRNRELHIDKGLSVIDFSLKPKINEVKNKLSTNEYSIYSLCSNKYFVVDKYIINTKVKEYSNENSFIIYTCIDGNGQIVCNNSLINISLGDSILIPATLGEYKIIGKCALLKSYLP